MAGRRQPMAGRLLLAGMLMGGAPALPAQTTEWVFHKTADGRHPDGPEQQMLWLLNRARANPTAEGHFLAASGDPAITSGIALHGVSIPLLKAEFAAIAAKPPAAFDRRLYEASRLHSLDLIARDAEDHAGQFLRISAAGFSYATGRVSVFSYGETSLHAHGRLNIDWGPGGTGGMQPGRGDRTAIMSDQTTPLTNAGFALLPDSDPGTGTGPLVFSGAYCSANPAAANHYHQFLVGTVWTDHNANSRYDPGEGIPDVRVQPGSGPWHALTGAGGGWAFPVTGPGTCSLTFSGGTLSGSFLRLATVGTTSVLVDSPTRPPFVLSVSSAPAGSLLLEWSGGTPPYQVQHSTTLAPGNWQNMGPPTSATCLSVIPSTPRAFYRVTGGP